MRRALRAVNRFLLALTGLVLLGAGGSVLLGGLDLLRQWHFPDAWPFHSPGQVLLTDAARTRYRSEGWWWPVVIATAAVIVLLALVWLLAQLRRHRLHTISVDTGDGDTAQVRGPAVEKALTTHMESLPAVDDATAHLHGRSTRPRIRLALRLAPHANPTAAVAQLSQTVLPDAHHALGTEPLPTEIQLTEARHRPNRVQ